MQVLSELHKSGRTVLVVTHDPRMLHFATHTVFSAGWEDRYHKPNTRRRTWNGSRLPNRSDFLYEENHSIDHGILTFLAGEPFSSPFTRVRGSYWDSDPLQRRKIRAGWIGGGLHLVVTVSDYTSDFTLSAFGRLSQWVEPRASALPA